MADELRSIIDEFQARLEVTMADHESMMSTMRDQYESRLSGAQQDMQALVDSSRMDPSGAADQPQQQPQEQGEAAAAWISAPDGEQLMVLNQAAVVMFLAVFGRISDVAQELEKSGKS